MNNTRISDPSDPKVLLLLETVRTMPGYTLYQHPVWIKITYPSCRIRIFWKIEKEKPSAYALTVEFYGTARILFGPLACNNSEAQQLAIEIAKYYKRRCYSMLCMLGPFERGIQPSFDQVFIQGGFLIRQGYLMRDWSSPQLLLKDLGENPVSFYNDNHKRNIRKAVQLGYIVRSLRTEEEAGTLGEIYQKMYHRKKIHIPFPKPKETFIKIYDFLNSHKYGQMLGAFDSNGKLCGGIVLGYHDDMVFYHYGASDPGASGAPILHLVFNQGIVDAIEMKFNKFDFGGFDTTADSTDSVSSVNRYKAGFRGTIVQYENVLEIPLIPFQYFLSINFVRFRRKLRGIK